MMFRKLLLAAALLCASLLSPSQAVQNTACMPTVGIVNGVQFATDVNNGFASVISNYSGTAAPTGVDCSAVAVTGMFWYDTSLSPPRLKIYDGTNFNIINPTAIGGTSGLLIQQDGTTPLTKIDITADQAVMLNASNYPIFASAVSVVIDTTTTGLNGMDTGTAPASTWAYEWLISNGSTVGSVMSLSATSPTMPGGYTFKTRVGAVFFDGSNHPMRVIQRGKHAHYQVQAATNTTNYVIVVNSLGTSAVVTAQSLSAAIPPTASEAEAVVSCSAISTAFCAIYTNSANGSVLWEYLSTSTSPVGFGRDMLMVFQEVAQNIDYLTSSTAGNSAISIVIAGWTDKGSMN